MPAFDMCSAPYRAGMSVRQSRTRQSRFELRCLTNSQARPSDQFAEWQLANGAVQAADEAVTRVQRRCFWRESLRGGRLSAQREASFHAITSASRIPKGGSSLVGPKSRRTSVRSPAKIFYAQAVRLGGGSATGFQRVVGWHCCVPPRRQMGRMRNGAVISANHGWRWIAAASCSMRK